MKYNHWNFRATLQMVKPTIVPTKRRTKQQFVMYFTLLLKHSSPMSKCFSLGSCSLLYVMTIGLCRAKHTGEYNPTAKNVRMHICTWAHTRIVISGYLGNQPQKTTIHTSCYPQDRILFSLTYSWPLFSHSILHNGQDATISRGWKWSGYAQVRPTRYAQP